MFELKNKVINHEMICFVSSFEMVFHVMYQFISLKRIGKLIQVLWLQFLFPLHEILNLETGNNLQFSKQHFAFSHVACLNASSVQLIISVAGSAKLGYGTLQALIVNQA